jgi:hypothetical protein
MAEQGQLELIPLTDEEKRRAGLLVARLTLELADMRKDHAEEKKDMADAEKALSDRIHRTAKSIRDGREPGIGDS